VRCSIERVGDHRSPPHKNKEQKKGKIDECYRYQKGNRGNVRQH
jgi:hypothetical protein